MRIRRATPEDAKALADIYSYYVKETAISFEYDPPSCEEFRGRMEAIEKKGYPYLVALEDDRIIGYCYANILKDREAYKYACETTIYLDPNAKGNGAGRALYESLEEELRAIGIKNLYACIGYPEVEDEYLTRNSADFHAHMGYRMVGVFKNCGRKFNRWYSMVWMEKIIGLYE
ncbi:MAG: GNAT family N-acetyltransferase [Lachnospiraceae bacterium]|nr:GNAT family N-acetyltransferase [Lachnospiraceae bacterium]